jgi:hypothetical protein
MAIVGCTDEECAAAFDAPLTPELLEHIHTLRAYGAGRIPKPTPQAIERERRRERYRPRWMRLL